jgi:succinate dehydrogenase/fumarate reductase iron-sulfur protein
MQVTFKVSRQDGRTQEKATQQSYLLDVDPEVSVFEALLRIREEQDGSLAFRGACGRGFCGDCTMRANGAAMVACLVPVGRAIKDGAIAITPIPNVRVVKDILFDVDQFLWNKYKSIRPWLVTDGADGHAISDEALEPVRVAMRCTMCGLCDEGCTVIDVDKEFVGPAALTKLFRIVQDPRETDQRRRFVEAGERRGLWDCVHCWEASEHCPWGINPTHRIMELRDQSVALGIKSGRGNKMVARHYDAFADSVRKSGWLNERQLAQKTFGLPPYGLSPSGMRSQMPIAIKAIRRGKANLLPHKKRGGAEEVAEVFKKVEEAHKKAQPEKGDGKQ